MNSVLGTRKEIDRSLRQAKLTEMRLKCYDSLLKQGYDTKLALDIAGSLDYRKAKIMLAE